ncbi:hypothetical protein [Natrinema sp. 1APR25-10V2]|uniref:hypothetical protein n=1 Tax=Natrinema sp. 1APR25-10V2 TaxID=2951081 RepID=UPI002876A208|nr:hypothetical protein [Natrinema sp. 1APR25-10V2]MDS0478497.1 hypothetical protein [Natrinema sp. 1APR25-10V2]
MVTISMVGMVGPAAAGGDRDVQDKPVYTLQDGEDLYLVFGADLSTQDLDDFIDAHAAGSADAEEQEAIADVISYQNVNQVNIQERGGAVSIAIDNGTATAVQDVDQQNMNVQQGEASAKNRMFDSRTTDFENVGDVHLLMANSSGGGQQFSGWGIADEEGEPTATQTATAAVAQAQNVAQLNYNRESTAFALAVNDSEATAFQQTKQANQNIQQGAANASNVYLGDGKFGEYDDHKKGKKDDETQDASAFVAQDQNVSQNNVNQGVAAVAIAVGEGSTATAIQLTDQSNFNQQIGSANAMNVISSMAGMNVANIGESDVVGTDKPKKSTDENPKKGQEGDGEQTATAMVAQGQSVEQLNVNLNNTAMAIAINGSEATAFQIADQKNLNAQVGYAEALNVYASPGYVTDSATQTRSTTVTVGGNDVQSDPGISYDYDTSAHHKNDISQGTTVAIEQQQFVTQQNLNQHSAVAVAEDNGSANAAQVSMQENENVQFTSVAATSIWAEA